METTYPGTSLTINRAGPLTSQPLEFHRFTTIHSEKRGDDMKKELTHHA